MVAKRKEDREVRIYAGYGRFSPDRKLYGMTDQELLELYDAVLAEITRRDLEQNGGVW